MLQLKRIRMSQGQKAAVPARGSISTAFRNRLPQTYERRGDASYWYEAPTVPIGLSWKSPRTVCALVPGSLAPGRLSDRRAADARRERRARRGRTAARSLGVGTARFVNVAHSGAEVRPGDPVGFERVEAALSAHLVQQRQSGGGPARVSDRRRAIDARRPGEPVRANSAS